MKQTLAINIAATDVNKLPMVEFIPTVPPHELQKIIFEKNHTIKLLFACTMNLLFENLNVGFV